MGMTDLEARVVALEAMVECLLTRLAKQSAVPDVWMADFKAELDQQADDAALSSGGLGDAARRGVDVGRLLDRLIAEAQTRM